MATLGGHSHDQSGYGYSFHRNNETVTAQTTHAPAALHYSITGLLTVGYLGRINIFVDRSSITLVELSVGTEVFSRDSLAGLKRKATTTFNIIINNTSH